MGKGYINMGKTKAQRKQEKKTTLQEIKKEQIVKNSDNTKKITEKQEKQPVKKPVGPEQVKLTMYTLIYMIVTFISAGVTAVAMMVYAKPINHVLSVTVGNTINDYSYEAAEMVLFENYPDMPIYGLYLGIAALVAVGAVLLVVGLIGAVNEYNKPKLAISIFALVVAVVALILFIYADDYTKEKVRTLNIPEQPRFGIYSLYMPLLITNIVGVIVNIFSTINGLKRWKKTGRTSK